MGSNARAKPVASSYRLKGILPVTASTPWACRRIHCPFTDCRLPDSTADRTACVPFPPVCRSAVRGLAPSQDQQASQKDRFWQKRTGAFDASSGNPSGHPLTTKNTLSPPSSVWRSTLPSPLSLRHKRYRPLTRWLVVDGGWHHQLRTLAHSHSFSSFLNDLSSTLSSRFRHSPCFAGVGASQTFQSTLHSNSCAPTRPSLPCLPHFRVLVFHTRPSDEPRLPRTRVGTNKQTNKQTLNTPRTMAVR